MKAAGLRDVDAVRGVYVRFLTEQLQDKNIKALADTDPSLDQTVMGSANFLQLYSNCHQGIAFILRYTNADTHQPAEWIITGTQEPQVVVRIAHTGSLDGGHFTFAGLGDNTDLVRVVREFTHRRLRGSF